MTVNLVDLVMKQVGGNVPGILGSLLGESADRTQGALAGAVPAVLGGLMGAASKGGGLADQLASAVGQQDDGILDNLAGAFGGGNHQQIADQGNTMLSSLLGDGVLGTLVGAVGKFSGLGGGSSKSLLGMLVPVVMSVLGRQQKEQGLDGGGLMNMLMGQKDHIQSALPTDLANAMGGAGFLDNLMGSAGSAAASVGEAVGEAADNVGDAAKRAASSAGAAVGQGAEAAGRAAQNVASSASGAASSAGAAAAGAAQSGGSLMRWLLPLIILLALLWLAFNYLSGSSVEETVSDAGDAAGSAVEATTEAAGDAVDAATDAASDAASAAADTASDAVDAATDAADDAATAVTDAASDATDAASDAASAAADTASDAADAVTDTASDATAAVTDAASGAADTATDVASDASTAAADAATDAVDAAASATGDAAGALTDSASDAAGSALGAVTAMVGDVDVGSELTSTFDGLTETLSGITDLTSAEAAVPTLEDVNSGLDSLTGLAGLLPEGSTGGVSELVSGGLSSLDGTMSTLESIPGVSDVIKPIVDQIKDKLSAFVPA